MPNRDERDVLSNLPGYALRRAANAMMSDLATRLGEADLRISDASVLMIIGKRTDLTSSEIGKVLDIQRANMVPLLNRLEQSDLIIRKPIDRKSSAIILTDAGVERLEIARGIMHAFENDLISRIPAHHREAFVSSLNALWG